MPIDMPSNYVKLVNEPQVSIELESLRFSVNKGKPYGKESWTNRIVDKFNLKLTLRSRGRPKNVPDTFIYLSNAVLLRRREL